MLSPADDPVPAQLLHRYVPGLRFDTTLALEQPGTTAPRRLSGREAWDEWDAVRGLLTAATAFLRIAPRRPPRWTTTVLADPVSVQALAARWLPELDCCWEAEPPRLSPTSFRTLLLCLNHHDGVRWALVTGEEWLSGRQDRPRALLVLDALLPSPWAVGYNARLELQPGSSRALGLRANPLRLPLAYRGIDGMGLAVDVKGVLRLQHRITPPA
ncbi:hypothetical protein [uncultured Pseudacidovorax sp.]|uniref:hypothetical protein n=1 Tax=uncultured Pseudacidovorax sp. TaxID=679313 RepID=UPI00260142E8|nr:hypothetical protein [uncultured Pseudacidovorax sp.]